jgi:PST family polysaccharide transporter
VSAPTAVVADRRAAARIELPREDEVRALTGRGVAWSVLTVAARQGIGLATTVTLARLLTPDDYGLIGMVALLTGFLQAFADLGLSWAAVRHEGLTRAQADNLFWLNVAAGFAFWGACALSGPALSAFFGRPELTRIAAVMGASIALNGLTVQAVALMTRQMQLRQVFAAELAGLVAGAATAAALAWWGAGYWALVFQTLMVPAGRLLALLAAGIPLPGPPRAGVGTLALVKFGGYLMCSTFVNFVARNLDNLLIGKVWGATALGVYSRAYFLMSVPLLLGAYSLGGVMVPAITARKGSPAGLGRAYREAVCLAAWIGLPAAAGLFVAAPELVRLVYGPSWAPVAALLRWLALASMLQTVAATSGWLYIVNGRGRAMLGFTAAATAVQAVAFGTGIRGGPLGIAVAYVVANVLLIGPTVVAAHRVGSIELGATLRALRPVLGATLAAIAAGSLAGGLAVTSRLPWEWVLALKSTAGVLAFGVAGAGELRKALVPLLNR